MNEVSMKESNSATITVVRANETGLKVIQKKQRVKILQNMLAMNSKHNLSFNRLLWLEARFHGKFHYDYYTIFYYALFFDPFNIGLSKEELADQLFEVCESMKTDADDIFVQGLENLQKELLRTPLRKIKPNSLPSRENSQWAQPDNSKVVSFLLKKRGLIIFPWYSPPRLKGN